MLLQGLTLSWSPLALSGDTTAGGGYWYRDGRRVALEPVGDGRRGTAEPAYRSSHGGPLRRLGDRIYVCPPETGGEQWAESLAERYGLIPDGGTERVLRFRVEAPERVLEVANLIFESEPVGCAAPLWRKEMGRRALNDPRLGEQWHLNNDGTLGGVPGADLNAFDAWTVTQGAGVVVGVVDDGLEVAHPDLAANVVSALSHDYVDDDPDPTAGDHGTSVAGVVAAVGGNGAGGAGVAPSASLVGLRVMDDQGILDESGVADAFGGNLYSIDILNNSWGPPDNALNAFESPSELELSAIEEAIRRGRGGLGQIFVWAGGNGGDEDNSNLDGYANLRYTIAVTASSDQGTASHYAEEGANLLVNAPSSGGARGIFTTDRSGRLGYNSGFEAGEADDDDYTNSFGGTSSATPAVAGVVALMLAANPSLNWREVQQVLAASATRNDPDHPGWRRNAAGYWINERYGFGRVDAGAAVALASVWGEPLAAESNTWRRFRDVTLAIPDDDPTGVSSSIFVTDHARVEFVEVTVDISHTYWGDLALYLTSPSGTEVRLMTSRFLPAGARSLAFDHWVLGDTLHLGESARGQWTLRVVDEEGQDVGTLRSWGIRVYGAAVPSVAEELPLECVPIRSNGGAEVAGAQVRLAGLRHGAAPAAAVNGREEEDFGVHFSATPTGAVAEYLVVAEYVFAGGAVTRFQFSDGGWSPWNGTLSSLEGFQSSVVDEGGVFALHMGRLDAGEYRVYAGYRDGGGEVVYCPRPLTVGVTGG